MRPTEPVDAAELPLEVDVRVRDPWPTDVPLSVYARVHATRVPFFQYGAHFVLVDGDHSRGWWSQSPGRPIELPELQTDQTLTFDVFIHQGMTLDCGLSRLPVGKRGIVVPVRFGGTLADAIEEVASAELDQALSDAFDPELLVLRSYNSVSVVLQRHRTLLPVLQDVTIAVRTEILLDDVAIATGSQFWRAGPDATYEDFAYSGGPLRGETDRLLAAKPVESWRVRIRSDPRLALLVRGARKCWKGDLTLPLKVIDLDRGTPR